MGEAWAPGQVQWPSAGTLWLDGEYQRIRYADWGSLIWGFVDARGDHPVFVSSDGSELVWAVARYN